VFTYITKTGDNAGLKADDTEPIKDPDLFEKMLKHYSTKFTEIDVREMEMPQPMIAILDELDRLKRGNALYVRHKKIPLFLFPELTERHFNYVLKQAETEVMLIIYNQE
jgi:TusA-related sulfurtransferase